MGACTIIHTVLHNQHIVNLIRCIYATDTFTHTAHQIATCDARTAKKKAENFHIFSKIISHSNVTHKSNKPVVNIFMFTLVSHKIYVNGNGTGYTTDTTITINIRTILLLHVCTHHWQCGILMGKIICSFCIFLNEFFGQYIPIINSVNSNKKMFIKEKFEIAVNRTNL